MGTGVQVLVGRGKGWHLCTHGLPLPNPSDILPKLQLWNVPVVDWVTSFPPSHTCRKDGILVLMEIGKGAFQLIEVIFIHGIGLGMITKVHEGPQCNNEVRRQYPCDDTNEIALDISVDGTGNLF